MSTPRIAALAAAVLSSLSAIGFADTVTLNNGDKLTGTIGRVSGTELELDSPALGALKIDLAKVASYQFDRDVAVKPKDAPTLTGKPSGDASNVKVNDQTFTYGQVKFINPPAVEWRGAIVANFLLERGNTNSFSVGVDADAQLRRETDLNDDRTTLSASYNFGQSGGGAGGSDVTTDTDNWMVGGKYDNFWTEKWYGYATAKLEHDRIAALYYRVTPGVGIGYQWFETPTMKFDTEAGINYIREEYDPEGSDDAIAGRLAYHYENELTDTVLLFHNLEYLPAFEDPGDYLLNTDIGVRAKFTEDFFGQIKVLYKRDSTPAEGALKNDLQYMIGVGWQF